MSGSTSVPAPSLGAAGFIAPAESDILAGIQSDINVAFGGGLNPALTTPQGQLAQSIAAIVGNANDMFLALANGVDPAFATGRMQDAIGRIYYIDRFAAQSTVVQVLCSGSVNTVISAGATIEAADGNIYTCTNTGTIPVGGSITLSFACQATGPIACPAQAFTIYRTVPGWDTAVSSAAGAIGNNVESQSAFEARRAASVALNGKSTVSAIRGAVLNVPGVLDAYVIDNPLPTSTTVGGATLAPNSIYVAAVGGNAAAVATAIWTKKPPGCAYNGNTTVTVADSASGYSTPYPSYPVTFTVPAPLPILFAISIVNSQQVPANAATLIQNAVINAFSGGDGGARASIGSTIYASRYYAPVAALGSWAQIISILIGTTVATLNSVSVQIDQTPTLAAANITVTAV